MRDSRHKYECDYSPRHDRNDRRPYKVHRHHDDRRSYDQRRNDDNWWTNRLFSDEWWDVNRQPKASRQFQYNCKARDEPKPQDVRQSCYENGKASGSTIPNCYICRKNGQCANQCPTKRKGKVPAVNMVTTEVQQVTTRRKTKQFMGNTWISSEGG